MPKFGIKSALFGYFWARIKKKLLPYLKSAPSIFLIVIFCEETKMPQLRTEVVAKLFGWIYKTNKTVISEFSLQVIIVVSQPGKLRPNPRDKAIFVSPLMKFVFKSNGG